jgi:hypothetical protein
MLGLADNSVPQHVATALFCWQYKGFVYVWCEHQGLNVSSKQQWIAVQHWPCHG